MLYYLLRWISMVFALVGGAAVLAVSLMTTVSIVGRALWSSPIAGDIEMTQFGIALALSLSLPWCQLQKSNIAIAFFTAKAPRTVARVLEAFGAIALGAMVTLLAWRTGAGAISAKETVGTSLILSLPMWIIYAVLVPGFALTALIAFYQAVMHLFGGQARADHISVVAQP